MVDLRRRVRNHAAGIYCSWTATCQWVGLLHRQIQTQQNRSHMLPGPHILTVSTTPATKSWNPSRLSSKSATAVCRRVSFWSCTLGFYTQWNHVRVLIQWPWRPVVLVIRFLVDNGHNYGWYSTSITVVIYTSVVFDSSSIATKILASRFESFQRNL